MALDKWLEPLRGNLIVQRPKAEEQTKGGIHLPEQAIENPLVGVVLATGRGKQDKHGNIIPMQVKVGDTVLFPPWAGVELEGEEYGERVLLMREQDVLCVLNEDGLE